MQVVPFYGVTQYFNALLLKVTFPTLHIINKNDVVFHTNIVMYCKLCVAFSIVCLDVKKLSFV